MVSTPCLHAQEAREDVGKDMIVVILLTFLELYHINLQSQCGKMIAGIFEPAAWLCAAAGVRSSTTERWI